MGNVQHHWVRKYLLLCCDFEWIFVVICGINKIIIKIELRILSFEQQAYLYHQFACHPIDMLNESAVVAYP